MSSTTVSAKIPEELKHELEREGINVSATIRNALEEEVRRRRRDELRDAADELQRDLEGKLSADDVVESVRETRRER